MLALSGVSFPVHNLKVRKVVPKTTPKRHETDSEDSSVEEFEDAETFAGEDDLFLDNVRSKKEEPLSMLSFILSSIHVFNFTDRISYIQVPENVDDETIGCIQFALRFQERYGPLHPMFFQGSLDNAIKEACMKPAKDVIFISQLRSNTLDTISYVFFLIFSVDSSQFTCITKRVYYRTYFALNC